MSEAGDRRTGALLLAGGLGTRLRPLTDRVPKCLVEIGGRSLLDHWREALAAAEVGEVRINTHHLPEPVRDWIEIANRSAPPRFGESFEAELLGSAGTISANRDLADGCDEIVVVYADNLSSVDLGSVLAFHRGHADPFTMVLFRCDEPRRCGIAELDKDNRIVSFVEKPESPRSDLANAGIYVVDADLFRELADVGGFDIAFDLLPRVAGRMRGILHAGYHRDIGTPESLRQAEADLASGLVSGSR
ncbi:MAG: nucleotidyltransferase family protein [Planctomycetota bacterium]|nr:nucleotidyltransferase family protein [Planctomycetota bacterium]